MQRLSAAGHGDWDESNSAMDGRWHALPGAQKTMQCEPDAASAGVSELLRT
jgi:hypothetical protein